MSLLAAEQIELTERPDLQVARGSLEGAGQARQKDS
jgi:hypothetical protein